MKSPLARVFLFLFALTACLNPGSASAEIRITGVVSSTQISFSAVGERPRPGDILTIYSQDSSEILGYAKVEDTPRRARVITHSKNAMIRRGDRLQIAESASERHYPPGRADLQVNSGAVSARHRPLVFWDTSGDMAQTAETLTKNELLLSPIFNGFGLTDRMSVFTAPLALAFGATQMIVKYKAYETEDFKFSPTLGHAIILGEGTASGIGGYLDVQSNSKFISHTSFMVFRSSLVGNKRTGGAVTETTLGSVLRSQYEYILDSWDRLIFGPAYYFDTKTVGGNLSYLMVWDHFHFGFGLFTKSITELSWSDNGYSPTVTLFWRI